MEEQKNCLVQFKFLKQTSPGEEIHITGNIPSLGNWSIEKSEKMETNNQIYPLWRSKENIIALQNSEIQYKYLIFKDGKFFQWEITENNDNRRIKIENYVRLVIHDPGSNIEKCMISFPFSISNTPSKDDYNYESEYDSKINDSNININNFIDYRNNLNGIIEQQINNNINLQDFQICDEKNEDDSFLFDLNCDEDINECYEDNSDNIDKDIINNKEINSDDDCIICSFYLPLNIHKNNNGVWKIYSSNEPIYNNLNFVTKKINNIKWVGILKNFYKVNNEKDLNDIYDKLEKSYKMYPLRITKEMYKSILFLFKEIIEPIFHYISIPNTNNNYTNYWNLYRKFNEITMNKIVQLMKENSLLLLNDIYYFLVPSLLYFHCSTFKYKIYEKMSIGLFIHCPFPSIDIFKKIPWREEIMKSILNCSVIGFHSFESNRNFLNAAKILLNVDYKSTLQADIVLSYLGRKLFIRVNNITPEPELIKNVIEKEEFKTLYNQLKNKNKNKIVFVSIDSIQFLITIKYKLEGFRRFIEDLNENRDKIIYYQYIKLNSDDFDENGEFIITKEQKKIIDEIKNFAKNINSKSKVIEIHIENISYNQRLAILASANCLVRTLKRGSYSLGLYEFLLLKIFLKDTNLVEYMFSELSSINSTLGHSIRINPFDSKSIYNGFLKAYQNLCDVKNYDNKENDFNLVIKSSCKKWLMSFFKDIKNCNNLEQFFISSGIGLNFRLMKNPNKITQLNIKSLLEDYELSSKRLIFFNLEDIEITKLNNIISLLNEIGNDNKNSIFIMSKLNEDDLIKQYKEYKNLYLVSENGYSYIKPKDNFFNQLYKESEINRAKNIIYDILEPYTKNCQGSFIEIQQSCVIWNFSECDPEQGLLYSKSIIYDLENLLKYIKLEIKKGVNYIKISNKNMNKGFFASHIIKDLILNNKSVDYIWAIGNSENDEILFNYLNKKKSEIKKQFSNYNINIYTSVIGKKPSKALNYIDNYDKLFELINNLEGRSNNKNPSKSSYNIKKLGLNEIPTFHKLSGNFENQ